MTAILVLENGFVFKGKSVGFSGETCGEVVFNTSMTGYQEMLTDQSYRGQILTFTCPHIGNVGINDEDNESGQVAVAGVVMHHCSATTSSWRATTSLVSWLKSNRIVAISDIDTRNLTHLIRRSGMMLGCILTQSEDVTFALNQISQYNERVISEF